MSIITYGFIRARRTEGRCLTALRQAFASCRPCLCRFLQWNLSAALQRGQPFVAGMRIL